MVRGSMHPTGGGREARTNQRGKSGEAESPGAGGNQIGKWRCAEGIKLESGDVARCCTAIDRFDTGTVHDAQV